MVKKKRQSDPGENGDDSTESCDENVKSSCPHIVKTLNFPILKRVIRHTGFEKECPECKKAVALEETESGYEEDKTLWMCLRCGSQLCGQNYNKHALKHFNTAHSDIHGLSVNTSTWQIYCYMCDDTVHQSGSKKLHECIEYIKKQVANASPKILPPIELQYNPIEETVIKKQDMTLKGLDKAVALNLPRVRGLSNLGNTCFFNSVMQCLVQTPYLLNVLKEMATPGEKFTLPGGKLKLKGTDADKWEEVDLPPITGKLAEWGSFTKTLAETLADLQSGEGGTYSPRALLCALVGRLPQFGGGDQHDAHELLRQLLEAVRSEDLRRYQSVILKSLGMTIKTDPAKVDDEMRQKIKFYGQQASDTMLRPEQVFRGFLVSTLECQDCLKHSDRAEYFLDLSLPVAASRPQPPALARRKTTNEDAPGLDEAKSKHQLKKEKIAAKKAARKSKEGRHSQSNSKEEPSPEDAAKEEGKSSSEQSDADVEDNADEPRAPPPAHAAAAAAAHHMESGYSSEKVISSDSIRTSPVDLGKEKADHTPENPDKDTHDYKPLISLENLSNPDSGVASPEATKHNSTETVDSVGPGADADGADGAPERPPSRIAFAPPYANEMVSRGISAQGCASLLQQDPRDAVYGSDVINEINLLNIEPKPAERPKDDKREYVPFASRLFPQTLSPRYVSEQDECSVESCLSQFTAVELLTGNNKVGCEGCTEAQGGRGGPTVYTNATKRFLVSSPPAILILQLKRFQLGPRCMFRKMSKHVDFPTVLDLAPFCAMDKARKLPNVGRGQGRLLYSLYGLVEHSGSMHGGHYVAYVKVRAPVRAGDPRWQFLPRSANTSPSTDDADADADAADACDSESELSGYESGEAPAADGAPAAAPPGRWYYVSDSMVSEVSEEKVLGAQAYVLFYERIL